MNKSNKFLDFMAGKGFYLVLFLCVAAIGASGYMLFFRSSNGGDPTDGLTLQTLETPTPRPIATAPPTIAPATNEPVFEEQDPDLPVAAAASLPPTPVATATAATDQPPAVSATATAKPTEKPAASAPPAKATWVWPVKGEILASFSGTQMVFNPTMQDFRVHPGIDIAAAAETHVLAAGAGTVADITQDARYGTTVTITHEDGYVSKYANLGDEIPVINGQKVNPGDVIGSIGASAKNEAAETPHLHFELTKKNKQVDPSEVLPR